MIRVLAIDIGNTNVVVGSFQQGQLEKVWRLSTYPLCTSDEIRIKLESLLAHSERSLEEMSAIVVSSVVPGFTRVLQSARLNPRTLVIDHTWPFSFQIMASPPQQVGADRLVNAEAAVRDFGSPCIIVDSGTATTLCAISVNAQGLPVYLGGAIIPGIEMSMDALAKKTALLFTVDLIPPEKAIGSNTQEALKSGMVLGYASMLDGIIRRFRKELNLGNQKIPVIATGGISTLMKSLSTEFTHFEPDLTLKGIAYLYDSFCKR